MIDLRKRRVHQSVLSEVTNYSLSLKILIYSVAITFPASCSLAPMRSLQFNPAQQSGHIYLEILLRLLSSGTDQRVHRSSSEAVLTTIVRDKKININGQRLPGPQQ